MSLGTISCANAALLAPGLSDVWTSSTVVRHKWVSKANHSAGYARNVRDFKHAIQPFSSEFYSSNVKSLFAKRTCTLVKRSQKLRHIGSQIRSSAEQNEPAESIDRAVEIQYLNSLIEQLKLAPSLGEKIECLNSEFRVRDLIQTLDPSTPVGAVWGSLTEQEEYLLKCVVASGQGHIFSAPAELTHKEASKLMQKLVDLAEHLETFYDVYGGILGYQVTILSLMEEAIRAKAEKEDRARAALVKKMEREGSVDYVEERKHLTSHYHIPAGVNLGADADMAASAASKGIKAMPQMAEMYPVGGAGDRLGLVDEKTGEGLPSALLSYCGRPMFENLIRDLQAREYLYYRLYGEQLTTPVAVMTSGAKKNHPRISALCEANGWWGRSRDSFRLIQQSLVPVVEVQSGRWDVPASSPLRPTLKPGGHGVLWKLARDAGVLGWFRQQDRKAVLVRQISNPMAATDSTMLALSGVGSSGNKSMGFASCERKIGASEGMNVLLETQREDGTWDYGVSNVEYTDFERLGMEDEGATPGSQHSKFPANTNILYLGLDALEAALQKDEGRAALPGLLVNLTKKPNKEGKKTCRLESSMQSVAESMLDVAPGGERLSPAQWDSLSTFVTYNLRSKVTSSAKKKREPGSKNLAQTPDGSFMTLQSNAVALLRSSGMRLPDPATPDQYLQSGPSSLIWLHPALGPLWRVNRQKIQGGRLHRGAELKLEIAEVAMEDVEVDGSLLVTANNIMGHKRQVGDESILEYSDNVGRCRLHNVRVQNKGVDWKSEENQFWSARIQRQEAVEVNLLGNSEFEASNVTIKGAHKFTVPDGKCLKLHPHPEAPEGWVPELLQLGATQDEDVSEATPSWRWNYSMNEETGHVNLVMEEASIVQSEPEEGSEAEQEEAEVKPGRWVRWVAVPWGRLRRLGSNGADREERRGRRRGRRFRRRNKQSPQAA